MKVLIIGTGRMGQMVRSVVDEADGATCTGMVGRGEASMLTDGTAPQADVVIDFSHKDLFASVAAYVEATGAALVEGTTGYGDVEMARLAELGTKAPVIYSANYSLGVAVLRRAVEQAARALDGFDVEIVETHHNKKADAPSGTAKMLLKAVDPDGAKATVYGREGMVGARPAGEIGMHSLRGGTVAGTHTVYFFGNDEELSFTHRATSRRIFAAGALAAAEKLMSRDNGLYTFDELMFE
jgi:4-hydroxy-tetrahydrodipicolinate reductase